MHPILFTENTGFGTSLNDKTTMMEKGMIMCKPPLTFSRLFAKLPATTAVMLCYITLTRYFVLLTRLYGCVAEETCKPAESLIGTSLVITT